jgi:hypothetical protein
METSTEDLKVSGLGDFLVELLQLIALELNPPSLVSFSLTCRSFQCQMLSKTDVTTGVIPTTPKFGILAIPRCVKGFGVCVEAVKYDYPSLFDYWSGLVKIKYDGDGDWASPLEGLLNSAGRLKSKERTMMWIGKIYGFAYLNRTMARECLSDDWHVFVDGVASTDNIEKYETLVLPKQKEASEDEEVTEDEVNRNILKMHFSSSLESGSFKMAEYLAKRCEGTWETDVEDEDGNTFTSDEALGHVIDTNNGGALKWFLDRVPDDRTPVRKKNMLNSILSGSESPDQINVAISHPLFSSVPDDDIYLDQREYSTSDIFAILGCRPGLIKRLYQYLARTKEIDPRLEQYLKTLSKDEVLDLLTKRGTSTEVYRNVFGWFPNLFVIDQEFGSFFDCIEINIGFSPAVRLLMERSTTSTGLFEFLAKEHHDLIHTLIGENIFTDEKIVAAIKGGKLRAKENSSDKKCEGKKGVPKKKGKTAAR